MINDPSIVLPHHIARKLAIRQGFELFDQ